MKGKAKSPKPSRGSRAGTLLVLDSAEMVPATVGTTCSAVSNISSLLSGVPVAMRHSDNVTMTHSLFFPLAPV